MAWRVALATIAVGLCAALLSDTAPPLVDRIDERAVAIATLPCARDLQATSSGFVVDNELVVTVAHALYESRDFAVRAASGEWHRATIQHLDLERDLALLRVGGLIARPVELAGAGAEDQVRLVEGAASGAIDGVVVRRVNITFNILGSDETASRQGYELELAIDPGDSGAAVVDNQDRLVGIVFARSTRQPSRTWTTSVAEVVEILDQADVPEWECGPGSGAELDLREPVRERLAG